MNNYSPCHPYVFHRQSVVWHTFFAIIYIFGLLMPLNCIGQNSILKSFQSGNHERKYILYIPENIQDNAPLVYVFHGYSGSAEGTMKSFDFNKIADENGFAVCYPEGLLDHQDNHFWQVGYKMHNDIRVDDVKFITSLNGMLQKKYKLSKDNTFIVGFSNGGDFCNLLLCQTSGIFEAAAPIISCMMKNMYEHCQESEPTPLFLLNATNDDITYWDGDIEDTQGYGPYLSTPAMIDFRVRQNKATLSSSRIIASTIPNDSTSVKVEKYTSDHSKNQIWMHTYSKGGHGSPEYFNLGQEIWNFFSIYVN